ncbi:MAG: CDP-glycerol glycerophosphotransferase family protein [Actinomycetota bacterium]
MKYSPTRILGALRRRQLDWFRSVIYFFFRFGAIRNQFLFESFQGKVIGDSPLALLKEVKKRFPRSNCYFTISSSTSSPDGAIGVRHGSLGWLRALATSKVLVNNTNFPPYFRKRSDQLYIQTWHGTPLKRLGRDIVDVVPSDSYLKMMDREAKSWDYLISPSPYCTNLFPKAFNFSGKILETGYPRNDLLINAVADRGRIRSSLGIKDENQLVVLYAPTWRDTERTATGNWKPVNFLGHGHLDAVVLFRGHTNTHAAHRSEQIGSAIDVTNYPNVAELYLAADVLITDYSSSMFDFTVTGKPIIFLAPDIDKYAAKRGFYFDFEAEAPGPILRDAGLLKETLEKLDSWRESYAARYVNWQAKFNSLEDGGAAARVIDQSLPAFHSLFSEH